MIGIICAMQEEIEEIIIIMKNPSKIRVGCFDFLRGDIHNIPCVAALSGVGKVHAAMCAQTMIIHFSPDFILNVGVAGKISENIEIGDIVIAESAIQHDFDVSAFNKREKGEISGLGITQIKCTPWITDKIVLSCKQIPSVNFHKGIILTGDQFINSSEKLYELQNRFGGIACEMEAGSIAQVCYVNNIDFGIIRSVSDGANSFSVNDFELYVKQCSKNAANIFSFFIKSYLG